MTRDLENTLAELGPGYREVVDRLVMAYRPYDAVAEISHAAGGGDERRGRVTGRAAGLLLAASVAFFMCMGAVLFMRFIPRGDAFVAKAPSTVSTRMSGGVEYRLACCRDAAAVREIVRTQNPDGSWMNDFLTRQNMAALRTCSDAAAQLAYRKARRNLRVRGLL